MWSQFLSCREDKWRTMNGLTLLLPHGYEGMGLNTAVGAWSASSHWSSGDNIIVANCTTLANMFHVAPPSASPLASLLWCSPQKLLRYPKPVSSMADFTSGGFGSHRRCEWRERREDGRALFWKSVSTTCSRNLTDGCPKTWRSSGWKLHPFPADAIAKALKRRAKTRILFGSKKPRNMGGWTFMNEHMDLHGLGRLQCGTERERKPCFRFPSCSPTAPQRLA